MCGCMGNGPHCTPKKGLRHNTQDRLCLPEFFVASSHTHTYIYIYIHGKNSKRIGLGGIKVRDCLIKSMIILYDLIRHVNLYPTWVCSFSFCVQWNEIYGSPSIKTKPDQISSFLSFSLLSICNQCHHPILYIYIYIYIGPNKN